MNDEKPRNRTYSVAVLVGSLLALAGAVWLAILLYNQFNPATELVQSERGAPLLPVEEAVGGDESSDEPPPVEPDDAGAEAEEPQVETPTPLPEPALVLTPRLLIDSDLGTGSTEFSAVALNEDTNRLLIADDEGRLFEFDLDDAGLPLTPLRRALSVQVGAGDIEGLSWMFGTTYAIAHEDDGQITVVEIPDDTTAVTSEHLIRTIDTLIREEDGNGLEGVAWVPASGAGDSGAAEFVVVDERPPTMYVIDAQGDVSISATPVDFDMQGIADFSDIYVSPTGMYSVLSDEGRIVMDLAFDAQGKATVAGTTDLVVRAGQFEQPEGLVRSRDGTRLYVVGEAPGPNRFSFGFWSSE